MFSCPFYHRTSFSHNEERSPGKGRLTPQQITAEACESKLHVYFFIHPLSFITDLYNDHSWGSATWDTISTLTFSAMHSSILTLWKTGHPNAWLLSPIRKIADKTSIMTLTNRWTYVNSVPISPPSSSGSSCDFRRYHPGRSFIFTWHHQSPNSILLHA